MKLRLLVLTAFCPLLVSAQSFFDYFNPFYWLFNGILNAIISENAICFLLEGVLDVAIGEEDVIQCSKCKNIVNVFLFFPNGLTTEASCKTNAKLDLNNLPVTAAEFDLSVKAALGDVFFLAIFGTYPFLTVNDFTSCLTVNGKKICADYAGSIGLTGIEITSCEIEVGGTQNCNCQICGDEQSVSFNCPQSPELTTSGLCVSPLFVDL